MLLVAVLTNLLLTTFSSLIISMYRSRQKLPLKEKDNFILGINAMSRLLLVAVTLGSVFPIYGVPFVSFLTSLSVFSVAIAWLFKEYLTNYFDSFRIMFSTEFRIGDYIKVNENSKGIIMDITLRATKVKTDEGDILLIPNTTLMNNEVTNYSQVKFKRVIIPFTIQTQLVNDVSALERHLCDRATDALPEVVDTSRAFLRLIGVEQGNVRCAFELSIDQFSFSIEDMLHRTVLEAVIAWTTKQTN